MTDQQSSLNSLNQNTMKSKAFFKTNSRQRLIEAYARIQNDGRKKNKNWKKELFKKLFRKMQKNKRKNCLCHLKNWWNERKQFFNCCWNKLRNSWMRTSEKIEKTSMCETLKKSWRCSRLNYESQQQFERITIWMRTKSSDWLMKKAKHLICCSAENHKKSKSQKNRQKAELLNIASDGGMKNTIYWHLSKTNIEWIKNKQSRCWKKAVCWETNILNAISLISASSILWNITHSTRQIVWLRYMKHLKNERMCSLSDSDEVQKQRLHRCSFHDVSHTRKREILCDTHRQ